MAEEKPKTQEKSDRGGSQLDEKELFDARIILVSTGVNAKLAHMVNTKLLAMERADNTKPIYMFINSPGGEVHSGFSIFDTMRFIRPDVITVVSGLAASMGSIIALAAKPEQRFAFQNAKFLIHQPSISGGLAGSVSDIEIHARDLTETKHRIVELYAHETGMSEDQVKLALDRDRWMSPVQAKEFGLISKVVTSRDELKF